MSGTEEVEEAETIDTQDSWRNKYGRPKTQPWISIPSLFFAMCICSSSNEKVEYIITKYNLSSLLAYEESYRAMLYTWNSLKIFAF